MLELGAGIGRFTGELAKNAGQLIALDFIDSAIKKVCDIIYHFVGVCDEFVQKVRLLMQ